MTTRKQFIPQDWISDNSHKSHTSSVELRSPGFTQTTVPQLEQSDIERLISQASEKQIDLTSSYANWRDIGFALADEMGEQGRNAYHRLSQLNSSYNSQECNTQYNKCLKANGHGVTIKTLFFKAKEAGININFANAKLKSLSNVEESSLNEVETPTFVTPRIPDAVYNSLPTILQESTMLFEEGVERDVFLIGAIAVISACLPNVEGYYFDEPVSSHLYAFITAPAGSGKGKLKWAKYFAQSIHKNIVEQSALEFSKYEAEIDIYNSLNKNQRKDAEKPTPPKRKMFFIPANSSSAAFIQALADNDFKGLIFETEADTLAGTLKQDWGNFSDVLRKAFHHESTNMFRRKDSEYIEIEDPHLAIALSGTPKQVHNMMPDTENGLFSRFLYYAFEDYSDFKNPFISCSNTNYTSFFESKGKEIETLYNQLKGLKQPLCFSFTKEQGETFTEKFNNLYKRNRTLLGNDFNANSRRFGLITFRLAMMLRTLRILEDGDTTSPLLCNEVDYNTAIEIALTLEKHAIAVFQNLPKQEKLKGVKQKFYSALPKSFDRQGYLAVASDLSIKPKTAEKYIGIFKKENMLNHEPNKYTKIE